MFDFGILELLFILVIALLFVSPKDLPTLMYKLGRTIRAAQILFRRARDQLSDFMHEAEVEHYRQELGRDILDAGYDDSKIVNDRFKKVGDRFEKVGDRSEKVGDRSEKVGDRSENPGASQDE